MKATWDVNESINQTRLKVTPHDFDPVNHLNSTSLWVVRYYCLYINPKRLVQRKINAKNEECNFLECNYTQSGQNIYQCFGETYFVHFQDQIFNLYRTTRCHIPETVFFEHTTVKTSDLIKNKFASPANDVCVQV